MRKSKRDERSRLPGDLRGEYIVVYSKAPAVDCSRYSRFISRLRSNSAISAYLKWPVEITNSTTQNTHSTTQSTDSKAQSTGWFSGFLTSSKESKPGMELKEVWKEYDSAMRQYTLLNKELYDAPSTLETEGKTITVAFTDDSELAQDCNRWYAEHEHASGYIRNMLDIEEQGTVGAATWSEYIGGNLRQYVLQPMTTGVSKVSDFVMNEVSCLFGWEGQSEREASEVDIIRSQSWCAPSTTIRSMQKLSQAWWNGTRRGELDSTQDQEWFESSPRPKTSTPLRSVPQPPTTAKRSGWSLFSRP